MFTRGVSISFTTGSRRIRVRTRGDSSPEPTPFYHLPGQRRPLNPLVNLARLSLFLTLYLSIYLSVLLESQKITVSTIRSGTG